MIPVGSTIDGGRLELTEQPSLTWALDLEAGRVVGQIDGLAAVRQSVLKALQTDRFAHLIYSGNYGHELTSLIGKNPLLVQSEAPRMVREALMQDDRILGVEDIQVHVTGDQLVIDCLVQSSYGSFRARQEVTHRV